MTCIRASQHIISTHCCGDGRLPTHSQCQRLGARSQQMGARNAQQYGKQGHAVWEQWQSASSQNLRRSYIDHHFLVTISCEFPRNSLNLPCDSHATNCRASDVLVSSGRKSESSEGEVFADSQQRVQQPMNRLDDFLRASTAAGYSGVPTNTTRNWDDAGKIAAYRLSSRWTSPVRPEETQRAPEICQATDVSAGKWFKKPG